MALNVTLTRNITNGPQRNQCKERGWLRIALILHNILEDAYEPVWRRVLGLDPHPNLNPNPN